MRLYLILILLLVIPSAYALSTDMKELYRPGETMIIKFSGVILDPIDSSQVHFLRNGYIDSPFDYDIKRLDDSYYLYAVMPILDENVSNNYTLMIEDVSTTVNGQAKSIEYRQNFTLGGELVPYSISPGIVTTSQNFDIQIISYLDEDQIIKTNFPGESEILVQPGETTISYDIEDVSGGLYEVTLGDYTLPVMINKEIEPPRPVLTFSPSFIDRTILVRDSREYVIELYNNGNETLRNLIFEYDKNILSLTPSNVKELKAGESIELKVKAILTENIDERITVKSGNYSAEWEINLAFTEDESQTTDAILNRTNTSRPEKYCHELGGKQCSTEETCSINTVATRDINACCLGICAIPSKSYTWVGYVIGIILVGVLVYLYIRYKGTKKDSPNSLKQRVSMIEKSKP